MGVTNVAIVRFADRPLIAYMLSGSYLATFSLQDNQEVQKPRSRFMVGDIGFEPMTSCV